MASNRGSSFSDSITKLLNLAKRASHLDSDDRKGSLDNISPPQTVKSLRLMAVMFESIMACRLDGSRINDAEHENKKCAAPDISLSQRLPGLYNDYDQINRLNDRFGRLLRGEEKNRMDSIYNGWVEIRKRANNPQSIFYSGYNLVVDYSKKIGALDRNDILNKKHITNTWNSIYESISPWMTKEQGYKVLEKGSDIQRYIIETTMALKDLDLASCGKFPRQLYDFLKKSITDTSTMQAASCLLNTLHALGEAYFEETGEVMPSTTGILLDSISILMEISGYQSEESESVLKWLKKIVSIGTLEWIAALLVVQLFSVAKKVYQKDGKSVNDLIYDLCSILGTIYSSSTSVVGKAYKYISRS